LELLDRFGAGPAGVELNLAERLFVLLEVLAQHRMQSLRLLGAQVDAVGDVQVYLLRRLRSNLTELQKEVPEADSHLNAIGIAFPIVGILHDSDLRIGVHSPMLERR